MGAIGSFAHCAAKLEVENGAMGKSLYSQRYEATGCSATSRSFPLQMGANPWGRRAHILDCPFNGLVTPTSHETYVAYIDPRRVGCLLFHESLPCLTARNAYDDA